MSDLLEEQVATAALETRILLRTAISRDARMATAVLHRAGMASLACLDNIALTEELARGAGALILSEETLNGANAVALTEALAAQAPWSDVPVLVLARQGADSRAISQVMDQLVNVTVIERPLHVASLVSSVRTALRARRRQYELRSLLQGLHEADQRKTEFLATLAHELRNPLAPLSTALALLTREPMEPAEAQRYYELMGRQVDHLARLVNDLMEVSRITRGKVDLHMGMVTLGSVIEDAVEQSRPLFKSAGHALRVQLPMQNLLVSGDAMRLTQVFANLLNNAAKYTPAGGQISLVAHETGGEVVIDVSDNGVGIEPAMLDAVFDMFVQASGTAKAAQGGLGIGLTLAKSLVALHGGQVTARSDGLGRGSTVSVRLPLLVQPIDDKDNDNDNDKVDGKDSRASKASLAGTAILVVDDNRDAADTLSALLGSMGASTAVAYNADDALQAAQVQAPDVAILDIGMPGTDGYELARLLRQRPNSEGLILIAMTGWGQPADCARAAAAGFNHHCLKPMDLNQLLALI